VVDRRSSESEPDPAIEVSILGPLEVRRAGAVVALTGRRHGKLLVDLVLDLGRRISTETLVDHLWGPSPPSSATKTVHKYISELRSALGTGVDGSLATEGAGYVLRLPPEAVDSRRFEALVVDARRLPEPEAVEVLGDAEALWRGVALDGFADLEWAQPTAQRLEELRLSATERRLGLLVTLGRAADALPELEQLVIEHPLREEMCAQLMLACGQTGRRGDALAAFQRLRRNLAAELGIEPSSRLREVEREILDGNAGPTARSAIASRPGRLPSPVSSFVGRSRLIERLQGDLVDARLVTLTGAGGSGKTRVALEVVTAQPGRPEAGAIFVDLSSINAPDLVIPAVASAVGLPDQPGTEAAVLLQESFGGRAALLVLDNCEHVRVAVADLAATLLANCPDLTILATSREPLGIAGEQVRPVPPLGLPATAAVGVDESEAVRLFLTRAREADPSFVLDDRNRAAVVDICTRLDGMPLALELAAALIPVMSAADIAGRLDDRFALLDSAGGRPPRQSTLRAAIDWSHGLLPSSERLLFERVSVFPGSFDLAAAIAVGAIDTIADAELVSSLSSLVRRSMVVRAEDLAGTARYRLLDTLRAYGREILSGRPDDLACRDAHARRFAELAARAGETRPIDGDAWHLPISADFHNIRAALEHAVEHDPELGARMVFELSRYWARTDQVIDGLRHAEQLLDVSGLEPEARAKVLCCAAELRTEHGEAVIAEREATEALVTFEFLGNDRAAIRAKFAKGRALGNGGEYALAVDLMEAALRSFAVSDPTRWATGGLSLGSVRLAQGDHERAEQDFGEVFRWARRHEMEFTAAKALWLLGVTARHRGELADARDQCERALAAFVRLADRSAVAHVRMTLGDIARLADDRVAAGSLYTAAYEALTDIGDRRCTASAMKNLADLARHDDAHHASTLYLQCLDRRRSLGDRSGMAEALEGLAATLADTSQGVAAATVLGHAAAIRSDTGSTAPEVEREAVAEIRRQLAMTLPPAVLADAVAAGAAMTLDDAVDAAHDAAAIAPVAPGRDD
jgi:predicted ATPase/DNA-binding SARP family transcriptional activator